MSIFKAGFLPHHFNWGKICSILAFHSYLLLSLCMHGGNDSFTNFKVEVYPFCLPSMKRITRPNPWHLHEPTLLRPSVSLWVLLFDRLFPFCLACSFVNPLSQFIDPILHRHPIKAVPFRHLLSFLATIRSLSYSIQFIASWILWKERQYPLLAYLSIKFRSIMEVMPTFKDKVVSCLRQIDSEEYALF